MWKRREYPLSTWLEKFLECTESNSIWLISNVECTQCINCSQMDFVRFYSWFNWQHPRESEKSRKLVILLDTYQIWAIFQICVISDILPFLLTKLYFQVYFTTKPQLSLSQWESQFVDNNKLTTISDLTPHTIYTIRVEAYTSIGPGPLSAPVQVKTQQGENELTCLQRIKGICNVFQFLTVNLLIFRSPQSAQQSGGQWGGKHQHQAQMGAARSQWGEYHQLWTVLEWHLHTFCKCC